MSKFPKLSSEIIEEGRQGYKQILSEDLKAKIYEQELFDIVGKKIREQQYLKIDQLSDILHWRQPTRPGHYKRNDPERLKVISRQAFLQEDEEIKTHILTLIKGIATPSASKIMTVVFPRQYFTINSMSWQVLRKWGYLDKKYNINVNSWMNFLSAGRIIMKRFDISGRELDQILISLHLKYELNMNLQKFIPLDQFF